MKKWLKRLVLLLLVAAAGAAIWGYRLVHRQGLTPEELAAYPDAKVRVDERGIPTIEADSWEKVIEAQGYVTASQRFWHMDLIRRASAGRLAELFGEKAVTLDRNRRLEDWPGVADRATKDLTDADRALLDAYTRGVNRFLDAHPRRAGLEYLVLGVEPEPWSTRDTMFIVLIMSEQLATAAPGEAIRHRWRGLLGEAWFAFLFPTDHPWNKPLFGKPATTSLAMPAKKLPMAKIAPAELAVGPSAPKPPVAGSNSWAWCGESGCFLANDPHLAATVPHLWFMNRLRVSDKEWVVGVSIPGAPGVVLGMNPYLAWAFTNVGEDVDDYLREELSEDGKKYVERIEDGKKVWADVITKKHVVRIKGGATREVVSRHTSRGPIAKRDHLEGVWARRWLPLQPGLARPSFGTNRAKNWDEFNAALDEMRVPAQNVLMVDRKGNMGYRASGTGIERRVTGRLPQSALEGDWVGLRPADTRPRMLFYPKSPDAKSPRYLATANERMWVDEFGHKWAEDTRKDRIRTVLASKETMTREDMERLQLDSTSRYHRMVVAWLAEHANAEGEAVAMVTRWKKWDGRTTEVETFTEAIEAERLLRDICVGRVRKHLADGFDDKALPYRARQDSAWVIHMLENDGVTEVFGLDRADLATTIVAKVAAATLEPFPKENRWQAQHGFVGRVPIVGDWYRVPETEQVGYSGVPRVERPRFGASTRMVWDLSNPKESTWITPVGQSGHPFSPNFSDLVERYHTDRRLKVFDDGFEWWFAPTSSR